MSEDLFNGVSSGETSRSKGDNNRVPAGSYPELRLVKCEIFKSKAGARCFKATAECLVAANGVAEGGLVELFEKLEGNSHDSYNRDARARVMQFVGALFGFATKADIDANIQPKVVASVVDESTQPMTGTVFSGTVGYKSADSIFAKWSFAPVLGADGKPKVVRGKVGPGLAKVEPVAVTPVVAPVAVPAAPVVATAVPAGWTVHPADARFIYETSNPTNMKQVG